MYHDTTTEEIICTTAQALDELHELTKSHEDITGGDGLPVTNLIHCIHHVLNEAFRTLEEEQTQKPSTKNKIKAIAA